MNPVDRLAELEHVLDGLRQDAAGAAIILEGRNDALALEALGVGGTHLLIHIGRPLEARIDDIAQAFEANTWPRLILLTDWDRTGGRLAGRLEHGLAARVTLDLEWRRRLARASHAHCVEDVPGDLASLRAGVKGRGSFP